MTCNAESHILSFTWSQEGWKTLAKKAAPCAALFVNVFIVLKLYCIEPFAHIARIVGIQ